MAVQGRRSAIPALLPVPRFLSLIGFDAADVVRRTLHQFGDEVVSLFLYLSAERGRARLSHAGHVFREQAHNEFTAQQNSDSQ